MKNQMTLFGLEEKSVEQSVINVASDNIVVE